jgi:hypothetical protein
MNQLVPLPPKGEIFLVQPGCTGAHLQPASDGCAWVCGPASKSSARLFKLSQAAATKEKKLEPQLWLKSYGISAHLFPSAPLLLSTELIIGFTIQKFWNRLTIWKRNTTIASKTTAYTTNDPVSISPSACTSLRRCQSVRLCRESASVRNTASQTTLETASPCRRWTTTASQTTLETVSPCKRWTTTLITRIVAYR